MLLQVLGAPVASVTRTLRIENFAPGLTRQTVEEALNDEIVTV